MICLGFMKILSDCCFGENSEKKSKKVSKNRPHQILGVCETASQKEIKSAYKELMKIYHPDNYSSVNNTLKREEMEERSKLINWAYCEVKKLA